MTNAFTTNYLTCGFCRNKQLRSLFYEAIGKRLVSGLKVFLNFEASETEAANIYLWASTVNVSLSYGGPRQKYLKEALRIKFDENCCGELQIVCHLLKTFGSFDNLIARTLEVEQIKEDERLQKEQKIEREKLESEKRAQDFLNKQDQKRRDKQTKTENIMQLCEKYEPLLQSHGYRNIYYFTRLSKYRHFEKKILLSKLNMDELVAAYKKECIPLLKVGRLDRLANYTTQNFFLQLVKNINEW